MQMDDILVFTSNYSHRQFEIPLISTRPIPIRWREEKKSMKKAHRTVDVRHYETTIETHAAYGWANERQNGNNDTH